MGVILFTFLLFPIVMNFLSPYVIIDGAFNGSLPAVTPVCALFISSLFVGRLWCSWACPVAGLQEAAFKVNDRRIRGKSLNWIKWVIWVPWVALIVFGLTISGNPIQVNPLYLTETGISVDAPQKYVIYYFVLAIVFGLSVFVGRRTFCHTGCWMSPFMILDVAAQRGEYPSSASSLLRPRNAPTV